MSIILDALNKAEKDRAHKEEKDSPTAPDAPSKSAFSFAKFESITWPRKKVLIPLMVLMILLTGGIHLYKKYAGALFTSAAPPVIVKPLAPPKPAPDITPQLKSEALSLFNEGHFDESLAKWALVIEKHSGDAEAYNNKGVVLKKMGKQAEAREAYDKALELNPNYPEALNNVGIILVEDDFLNKAHDYFTKALAANPVYAEPHFHLGILLEKKGSLTEAVEHYEQFLALSPDINQSLRDKIDMRIAVLKTKSGLSR